MSLVGDRILTSCTKCADNYYLDNDVTKLTSRTEDSLTVKYGSACKLRTYLDSNCLKFQLDDDKCDTCAYGYFKDLVSSKCKLSPNGVLKCRKY